MQKKEVKKTLFSLFFIFLFCGIYHSQVTPPKPSKSKNPTPVRLINADLEEVNEHVFNGNMVYSGNVIAEHETSRLKADSIIYFQDKNFIEARGNINFKDKDTYLVCKRLTYDANTKTVVAYDNVKLTSPDQIIETEKLIYDANAELAYFDDWGTVYKDDNVTRTKVGKYFVKEKRIELGTNSTLESPDYIIKGSDIKYNTQSGLANFNKFTEITNKKDPSIYITGTQGTYNTKTKESVLKKDGVVHYQGKILSADDLYFNEITGYGKGIKNVKLNDPKEKRYLIGDYGEVFQFKDSAFVTGRPYMVKAFTKDSLYMHSDTLIAVQDINKQSVIRGFHNGRIFKSNMSGKSDSLVYHESVGQLDFYKKPIFWASGGKQLISDTLSVYLNNQTQAIDSVYGRENAFVISKVDSLSPKFEFNQAKGRHLYAYFDEDKLHFINLEGNAESVAYVEEESKTTGKKERTGIAKSICGILLGEFINEELDIISCQLDAQSKIYPESKLPEPQRFLPQFNWRGNEQLRKWEDIFPDVFPDKGIKPQETLENHLKKAQKAPPDKKENTSDEK